MIFIYINVPLKLVLRILNIKINLKQIQERFHQPTKIYERQSYMSLRKKYN